MTKSDPKKVDRDALHQFFWKNADTAGKLRINQSQLARDMALDRTTVARIMREMELQGRVSKISEGQRRLSLYKIIDPEIFKWNVQGRKL